MSLDKITPKQATLDTIRYFEGLPEKMYKRKIAAIVAMDMVLFYYILKVSEYMDSSYNIFEIIIQMIFFIMIYVVIVAIVCGLPYIYKNSIRLMKFIMNIVNPFSHKKSTITKTDQWSYRSLYFKRTSSDEEKLKAFDINSKIQKKEEKRKKRKYEPFLMFRATTPGRILRKYLFFLHVVLYAVILTEFSGPTFEKARNILLIGYLAIYYLLLRKQPEKTEHITNENLKLAFHYYISPEGRKQLSSIEKENFDKNFIYRTNNESYHRKGYFTNGIYHNQEFHYESNVHVEDLVYGFKYYLVYPTDHNYENWGFVSGKERVTKYGRFMLEK